MLETQRKERGFIGLYNFCTSSCHNKMGVKCDISNDSILNNIFNDVILYYILVLEVFCKLYIKVHHKIILIYKTVLYRGNISMEPLSL